MYNYWIPIEYSEYRLVSSHDKIYLKIFSLNIIKYILLSIFFFLCICLHFPIIYVKFITWLIFEGIKLSITFYKEKEKLYKYTFTENISRINVLQQTKEKEVSFPFMVNKFSMVNKIKICFSGLRIYREANKQKGQDFQNYFSIGSIDGGWYCGKWGGKNIPWAWLIKNLANEGEGLE